MYITPGTEIRLLKNVPISNNYKDTLYFANYTDQNNYFLSKSVWSSNIHSYQRLDNNTLRVDGQMSQLYDCNYMMFRNDNYENKWFYAFILSVDYVNNTTCEIKYEIDIIQSWWFKVDLQPCMVVRQHAVDDGLYVNCEPEDFPVIANYVHYSSSPLTDSERATVFLTYTTGHYDPDDTSADSNGWVTHQPGTARVQGLYSSLEIRRWTENTVNSITAMADYLGGIISHGHEDDIIAVIAGPGMSPMFTGTAPIRTDRTVQKSTLRQSMFQGYVPRNNKIYNYPFCKIVLEKPGVTQEYAYEDFRDGTTWQNIDEVTFNVTCTIIPTPSVLVYPKNYRGETNCYNSGLEISDFPVCPIKGDTYAMWLVQNSGGYVANAIGSVANFAVDVLRGDTVGTFIDIRQGIQGVANAIGQGLNNSNKPDNVKGFQKGNIMSNINQNTIWLNAKSLDYWEARQVDTYFDMFGYKENHIMMPNIHARQRWTYVQTAGCTITGDAPSEIKAFIEDRFNKGITWWADHANVGRYDLTNPTL